MQILRPRPRQPDRGQVFSTVFNKQAKPSKFLIMPQFESHWFRGWEEEELLKETQEE